MILKNENLPLIFIIFIYFSADSKAKFFYHIIRLYMSYRNLLNSISPSGGVNDFLDAKANGSLAAVVRVQGVGVRWFQ